MLKEGFISWSGEESRNIAENLQQFLRFVLANPTLFVASKDIKAGDAWFSVISQKLDVCDVGIIVVTPQNKLRPWLHFEAGAIAKRVGSAAAIPLLCGVAMGDLSGTPLAQLQALEMTPADLRVLCTRLNEILGLGLPESHIDEAFGTWWAKYEEKLVNTALWGGGEPAAEPPTIADVSVQLSQISASIVQLNEQVRRTSQNTAPAIYGQGQLATMNVSDLQALLFPATAPHPSATRLAIYPSPNGTVYLNNPSGWAATEIAGYPAVAGTSAASASSATPNRSAWDLGTSTTSGEPPKATPKKSPRSGGSP